MSWIPVCPLDEIEVEDVYRFEHAGALYAVCRDSEGDLHAVSGLCTHEHVDLTEGFVFGCILECPRHNGRFRIDTGATDGGPVTEPLKTFPTRVQAGLVYIEVPD